MTLSNKTVLRLVKPVVKKRLSKDAIALIKLYIIAEAEALAREAEAALADENALRATIGERPKAMIGLRQVNRVLGARTRRNAPGAGEQG